MCVCVCVYAAVSECVNASAAVVSEGTKKREKKKNKRQIEKGKELDCSFDCFSIRSIVSNGFVCFFWVFCFWLFSIETNGTNEPLAEKAKRNKSGRFFFFDFSHLICFARVFFSRDDDDDDDDGKEEENGDLEPTGNGGRKTIVKLRPSENVSFFSFHFLTLPKHQSTKTKQKKGNERSQSKKNKTSSLLLLVRSSGHHASVLSTRSSVPVFHSSRFTFQRFFFFFNVVLRYEFCLFVFFRRFTEVYRVLSLFAWDTRPSLSSFT